MIYNRCSTEEESQREALVKQEREARECVAEQGWILVDIYIEAKSGTLKTRAPLFLRSKGLQRHLAAMASISTNASLGSRATSTALRAGGVAAK